MAMTLNASIPELEQLKPPRGLDEFSYGDGEMANILLRNTLKTEFVGLTVSWALPIHINAEYSVEPTVPP